MSKQKPKGEMTYEELKQKLTDKQLLFVEEYLSNGKNATIAYLDAFGDNVTYDSAKALASKLLKEMYIQRYIRHLRDETIKNLAIDRNFIIQELLDLIESAKTDENVDRSNWNKSLQQLTELLGLNEEETINLNHKVEKININIVKKSKK